jgi:hypothetical protein
VLESDAALESGAAVSNGTVPFVTLMTKTKMKFEQFQKFDVNEVTVPQIGYQRAFQGQKYVVRLGKDHDERVTRLHIWKSGANDNNQKDIAIRSIDGTWLCDVPFQLLRQKTGL